MKKAWTLVLALVVTMALSGCYGPFALTKKIHKWNGQQGDKFINEAIFLVLVVVPVYQLAALGDAVLFNSIQFWTGENPVTGKAVRSVEAGDRQVVMSYSPEGKRLRLDMFRGGRSVGTAVVAPGPDGRATLTDERGTVTVVGADGRAVSVFRPGDPGGS